MFGAFTNWKFVGPNNDFVSPTNADICYTDQATIGCGNKVVSYSSKYQINKYMFDVVPANFSFSCGLSLF